MASAEGEFEHYDVVVLGSGQAGNPLSTAFAEAGKRVALIERAAVGGTCINYGCTPTKTMVASAQRAYQARHAGALGVEVSGVQVDMKAVRARMRSIVAEFRTGSEKRFAGGNPELVRGDGSFLGPKEVRVRLCSGGERRLRADTIVIDTGTSPSVPPIEGLRTVPVSRQRQPDGTGQLARAPGGPGRRIHRGRVWADVPPPRESGHDH